MTKRINRTLLKELAYGIQTDAQVKKQSTGGLKAQQAHSPGQSAAAPRVLGLMRLCGSYNLPLHTSVKP